MAESEHIKANLVALFTAQKFAVLATEENGQPHTHLMAFVAGEDLRHLAFATERDSQKFMHLKNNEKVALLVTNSKNDQFDTKDAMAVGIQGNAVELESKSREHWTQLYAKKHPYLKSFITSDSCAVFRVAVTSYKIVSEFSKVIDWQIA